MEYLSYDDIVVNAGLQVIASATIPFPFGTLSDGSAVTFSESLERSLSGKTFQRVNIVSDEGVAIERESATQAERARILAALEKIKPGEQPYTRRDWALEQRGELRMWERMVAAIGGQEQKGGA